MITRLNIPALSHMVSDHKVEYTGSMAHGESHMITRLNIPALWLTVSDHKVKYTGSMAHGE